MKQLSRSHLFLAVALSVLTTDAQVTLTTLNPFICGEEQILKCKIEPYSNTMTWTKDTFPNPLASCTPFACSVNPSMSAIYNFTFETDKGIFYMEIPTVKVADNGTIFSCDNGFVSAKVTSNVTVEDNYSIVKYSEPIDSDTTEVSCTTGCIKNNTLEAVQFEWWFQEVNNTDSEKIKVNESESKTNYNSSVCMTDTNCGVLGYSYAINVINITNEENGKNYSLGVDITSGGNLIKIVYYDLIFTRNFPRPEFPIGNECVLGITTAYLIIFVTEMSMCIYGRYMYSSEKQRREKLGFFCTTFWISFALSLPLIGLFVKGARVIKRMVSDHLPILKCCHLVLIWAASFICELLIILLCIVRRVCQWYALFFVFPDLIFSWILFIIIFYKDKDKTSSSAAVPALSVREISLLCMSFYGWVFGLCWCDRRNATEKTTQQKEQHVTNLPPKPEQKADSNEKPVRRLKKLKTKGVVKKENPPLPPIGSRDKATRSTQLDKNEVVTKEHSPLAQNKDRDLVTRSKQLDKNGVVTKEHSPLAQNKDRDIATRSTQLNKNELVTKEHSILAQNKDRDLGTRSTQLDKNGVVTKEHSPLAQNKDRSLPGSHDSSKFTMTRGISSVTFPDEKDDMAFVGRPAQLYSETLQTIPQHQADDQNNQNGHHNHVVHHNRDVHHNHDEHHHHDAHHHLLKEDEMTMKQLKPYADEALAAGKDVEWKLDKLYINNCLYHPEGHHIPSHSNTTKHTVLF